MNSLTASRPLAPRPAVAASPRVDSAIWAHLPWLAALLIAPLWFGAVGAQAQIALALLISTSLIACSFRVRAIPETTVGRVILFAFLAILLLPLLPMPIGIQRVLSPATVDLAAQFPIESTAPGALPLALSPAGAVIRLWQLAILGAAFLLARDGVRVHRFSELLSLVLAIAVLLCGAAQVWFLFDGKGVWSELRNYPGGTFANRSHFASWIGVASLYLFAPLMREVKGRKGSRSKSRIAFAGLLAAAVLMGCCMTLASGSRGGVLSLAVGGVAWAVLLFRRKERGVVLVLFALIIVIGAIAFAIWGDRVMGRIQDESLGFKLRIWRDSLALFARFPIFGIGLGGFEEAFNHFKTFHGRGTFLFAENEYLEWFVETGLAGGILAIVAFAATARFLFGRNGALLRKEELFQGAIVALIALCAHAFFEFLFHVMAVALLGAVLLGIAVGLKARAVGPRVLPPVTRGQIAFTMLLACGISGLALLRAQGGVLWNEGITSIPKGEPSMRRGLELWPMDERRAAAYVRRMALAIDEGTVGLETARARAGTVLATALRWRPYNWELRLEEAWFDLAFGLDRDDSMKRARRVVELAPLQPGIPLRFAAVLATMNPPEALSMLKEARVETPEEIRLAIKTAWRIQRNPALLWEVIPATSAGLRELLAFAKENDLPELAAQTEKEIKATNGTNITNTTHTARDRH